MSVIVYSKSNCVQCNQTKKMLERLEIPFSEEDLESEANFDKLKEFRSMGISSAPVVVAGDDIWGGFRVDKLKSLSQ